MPLAETHALKRWGGTLGHQSPSVVARSIHRMIPQISGRVKRWVTRDVLLWTRTQLWRNMRGCDPGSLGSLGSVPCPAGGGGGSKAHSWVLAICPYSPIISTKVTHSPAGAPAGVHSIGLLGCDWWQGYSQWAVSSRAKLTTQHSGTCEAENALLGVWDRRGLLRKLTGADSRRAETHSLRFAKNFR